MCRREGVCTIVQDGGLHGSAGWDLELQELLAAYRGGPRAARGTAGGGWGMTGC